MADLPVTAEELQSREVYDWRTAENPTPYNRYQRQRPLPPYPLSREELAARPRYQEVERPRMSEFELGARQAGIALKQGFAGFLGAMAEVTGSMPLREAAVSMANEEAVKAAFATPPRIAELEQIESFDDFADWAAQGFGQLLPSMALTVAGGGVSGFVGRQVLKQGIKNTVRRQMAASLAGRGSKKEINTAVREALRDPTAAARLRAAGKNSAMAGVTAVSGAPQAGGIFQELREAGVRADEAAVTALAGGALGGALDSVIVGRILDKFFPGVTREFSRKWVKDFVKEAGLQSLVIEGGTEAAQEAIALAARAFHDPNFDIASPEAKSRVLNAYALGALGGAATGSVTGAFSPLAQLAANKRAKVTDEINTRLDSLREADETVQQAFNEEFEDTAFPTVNEIVTTAVEAATEYTAKARETVVTALKRSGIMDSSVGAQHVTLAKRAITEIDQAFYTAIAPKLKQLRDHVQARVTEIRNTMTNPEDIAAAVETVRAEMEATIQELIEQEFPREYAGAESRTIERMRPIVEQMEEALANTDPVEEELLTVANAREIVEKALDREIPETVMAQALQEAGIGVEDTVTNDAQARTQEEVDEEELAAQNSRRLQEQKRGVRESFLGQRAPRNKTVLKTDGTTKTFETERRTRREIRADEEGTGTTTVEDDLVAFPTEEAAQAGLAELEADYALAATLVSGDPEATDSSVAFEIEALPEGGYAIRVSETGLMDRSEPIWDASAGESLPMTQYVMEAMERAAEDARGNPRGNIELNGRKYRMATLVEMEQVLLRNQFGSNVSIEKAALSLAGKFMTAGIEFNPNVQVLGRRKNNTLKYLLENDVVPRSVKKAKEHAKKKAKEKNVDEGAVHETRTNTVEEDQAAWRSEAHVAKLEKELEEAKKTELTNEEKAKMRREGATARDIMLEEERRLAARAGRGAVRPISQIEAELEQARQELENFENNRTARADSDPFIQGNPTSTKAADKNDPALILRHSANGRIVQGDEKAIPFPSLEAAQKYALSIAAKGAKNSAIDVVPEKVADLREDTVGEQRADEVSEEDVTFLEDLEERQRKENERRQQINDRRREKNLDLPRNEQIPLLDPVKIKFTGRFYVIEQPFPSRTHADPVFDTESYDTENIDTIEAADARVPQNTDTEQDQLDRSTMTIRTGQRAAERKIPSLPSQVQPLQGGSAPTPNAKQAALDERHRRGSVYGDEEFEQVIDTKPGSGTVVVQRGGAIGADGNVRVMFSDKFAEGAQAVARLIADLANRIGLRNGINVVDATGLQKIKAKALKNKNKRGNAALIEAIGKIEKAGPTARAIFHNSQIVLYVNNKFARDGAPEGAAGYAALMHEFGHAVFQVYFHRLSIEAKMLLFNQYAAENPEFDIHADPENYRRALRENENIRRRFNAWRKRNNKPAIRKRAEPSAEDVRLVAENLEIPEAEARQRLIDLAAEQEPTPAEKGKTTRQYREWLKEEGLAARSFEEWMANQWVGWVMDQARTLKYGDPVTRDAVRGFFRRMQRKMRQIFNWFKQHFGVTETYNDFIQGIMAAHEGRYEYNVFSQSFMHDGPKGGDYMGYQWFGELPAVRAYEDPPAPQVERFRHKQAYSGMLNRMEKLGAALRDVKLSREGWDALKEQIVQAYRETLVTLNGRVREMAERYDALEPLTAIMRPKAGQRGTSFNVLKLATVRQWEQRLDKLVGEHGESAVAAARDELMAGNEPTTEAAKALREYLNAFYRYMRNAGLPIREVKNYFPRVLDREAILSDPNARSTLAERYARILNISPEKATREVDELLANVDEASRQALAQVNTERAADQLDIANPYAGNFRSRKLTKQQYDQLFEGYIEKDISSIFQQYIPQMVRMAEYNRVLGERSTDPKTWNPNAKLEAMINAAREQGMTDQEVAELEDIVDTWLGRRGIAMNDRSRKLASWIMTYQNLRVLLFTVFASFPDMFTSAVRTGSFKTAYDGWRNYITQGDLSREDLAAMARTWGIIADHLNQSAMADHFTASFMTEGSQRMSDKFFRATGLLMYTNFTRKLALSVGFQYINEHNILAGRGNADSQAKLKELGLTWDTTDADGNTVKGDVTVWMENGHVPYGTQGYTLEDNPDVERGSERYNELHSAFKIRNAMFRFVDESVMRPDASQRPGWGSDPRWMLFFHLKSFMYSFQETVLKRVLFEMKNRQGLSKLMPLLHLSLILPATALGLELRELIQYAGSGAWGTPDRQPRTDRMNAFEYMVEVATRSGMTGPSQLALDLEAADDRNQFWLMGIAGPTFGQAGEIITKPFTQTIPKAIPVASQLPWMRDLMRGD